MKSSKGKKRFYKNPSGKPAAPPADSTAITFANLRNSTRTEKT
jgi:hypothetical protein